MVHIVKTLIKPLETHSTGKTVLGWFILTTMVYLIMLFITIPKVMAFSDGMRLLDMMPGGYDLDYVNVLFQTLSEQGRTAYLSIQLPVDMIYPGLFAVSYSLMIAFFLKKINKLDSLLPSLICYLPVIAGLSDYLENFSIIRMLNKYPDIGVSMVASSNWFSIIKSSTTSLYFIVLVGVLVSLGIKSLRNRKSLILLSNKKPF